MKRQTACGRRLASTRRVGAALHAGAAGTTKRKTRPKTRPPQRGDQADAALTPTLPRRRPSSSRRPRLVQQCKPDGLRRNSSDTAAPFAAPEPDFRRPTTGKHSSVLQDGPTPQDALPLGATKRAGTGRRRRRPGWTTSSRAVSPSRPSVAHRHSMGAPTQAAPHSHSGLRFRNRLFASIPQVEHETPGMRDERKPVGGGFRFRIPCKAGAAGPP